jgi:hypothetical protein
MLTKTESEITQIDPDCNKIPLFIPLNVFPEDFFSSELSNIIATS